MKDQRLALTTGMDKKPPKAQSLLGRMLMEWRRDNGLSREDLAAKIRKVDRSLLTGPNSVQCWELYGMIPRGPALRALAQLLGRSVAELTRLANMSEQTSEPTGRIGAEEDRETQRRTFLAALGVGAAGGLDFERLASPMVDRAWLADAEAVSVAVAGVRSNVAPATLAPAVLGHLAQLEAHLPDTAEVTAQTAVLAGSLLVKAGALGQAWRCYSLAEALSADVTIKAKAMNGRAGVLVRHGLRDRPAASTGPAPDMGRALELQERAVAVLAGGPARAQAGIVARLAEMRAEAGDDAGAMRDLETAGRLIDHEGYEWWYLSPEAPYQLGAYRGSVLALLGRHSDAVAEWDWTLARMPVALADWRTKITADRDRALAAG